MLDVRSGEVQAEVHKEWTDAFLGRHMAASRISKYCCSLPTLASSLSLSRNLLYISMFQCSLPVGRPHVTCSPSFVCPFLGSKLQQLHEEGVLLDYDASAQLLLMVLASCKRVYSKSDKNIASILGSHFPYLLTVYPGRVRWAVPEVPSGTYACSREQSIPWHRMA